MSVSEQEERIAVLLSSLGDEIAGQVIGDLPGDAAARVQHLLQEFKDDPLEDEEIEDVLDEFLRFFRFAVQSDPDVAASGRSANTEAAPKPKPKKPAAPEPEAEPFVSTGDPFQDLNQLAPFQLGGGLRSEGARTIAVVLNCVEPEVAGAAMQYLPDEIRGDVFLSMRTPPKMPQPLLERIVTTTVNKASVLSLSDMLDPVTEKNKKLADLLRAMEQAQRAELLRALEESDPEGVADLKKLLYSFDDLENVADRTIQKILGEVPSSTLAMALKDVEGELADRIMGNLSKRARATLEEEIEFMGNIKDEEQQQARESVCDVMAKLDETGDLEMLS